MPSSTRIRLYAAFLAFAVVVGLAAGQRALAGAPGGSNWFQLFASPFTGGDNTGDGGTGLPANINYYYVGQTFTSDMGIQAVAPGSNAANIWIDYVTTTVSASNLNIGTFYPTWSNQNIIDTGTTGRVRSTGYRTSGYSIGTGTFGNVQWTMVKPTAANYGTSASTTLTINTGVFGATTESNISKDGTDVLDSKEDFTLFIWADTKKPYALNPSPANAAVNVAIDQNYTFDLRDSKNGEGDNSGVGTGVDTTRPPGAITANDGGGPVSQVGYDSFSCSGVWGTNLCGVTVNPPSPLGIVGDTRNWNYATTYTLTISGFRDLASASQNQLGDTNGPNTMDPKAFTFTTEADTVKPRVTSETPVRASSGNATNTNLIIDVTDRKTYPNGPSGTGVATSTCSFNVSSPSFALTTYASISAGVSVVSIPYGLRFTIDPASNFAQNETVTVSAFNCADLAGNVMVTDTWTFATADTDAPYVDGQVPANDAAVPVTSNIVFHVKDNGSGVDLSNTVVFVNGTYYTNAGGAGQVTVNGTRITFASSLNFNGGNYVGDTTGVSGPATDKTITIDPQGDFTPGEAVPVIVYSRDTSGNLMERVVYAFVVDGAACSGSCPAGSSYCGANTSFSGGQCVGTGGGSSSGGSGGGGGVAHTVFAVNDSSLKIEQIDEHSVLVSWTSNVPGTGRVLYDTQSPTQLLGPNLGYRFSTPEAFDNSTNHYAKVENISPGQVYFFRPVSRMNGNEFYGSEGMGVAKFATEIVTERVLEIRTTTTTVVKTVSTTVPLSCPAPVKVPVRVPVSSQPPASPSKPAAPRVPSTPVVTAPPATVAPGTVAKTSDVAGASDVARRLSILEILRTADGVHFSGDAEPGVTLTLTIY